MSAQTPHPKPNSQTPWHFGLTSAWELHIVIKKTLNH
jgi:hypothetical protein